MTIHPSTLAAVTRLAQERGLPLVTVAAKRIVVGHAAINREYQRLKQVWVPEGSNRTYKSAPDALRAALRMGEARRQHAQSRMEVQ